MIEIENSRKLIEAVCIYLFSNFIFFFIVEGFFKPIIAGWGERAFNRLLPELYKITDATVLRLLDERSEEKLVAFIREKIFLLEPSLSEKDIEIVSRLWAKNYNPLQAIKTVSTVSSIVENSQGTSSFSLANIPAEKTKKNIKTGDQLVWNKDSLPVGESGQGLMTIGENLVWVDPPTKDF
jgi:hypothetical protein